MKTLPVIGMIAAISVLPITFAQTAMGGSGSSSSGGSSAAGAGAIGSAGTASGFGNAGVGATDPAYKLSAGDQISFSVYDEPDFNANQMIDLQGKVRLPHLGDVDLTGKSVREAERFLEKELIDKGYLKKPLVNIVVTAYAPREVLVLGQVRSPSSVQFPRDATTLDIVDVISRVGGFTPVAKSTAVRVGRRQADGTERVFVVNVESMMKISRDNSRGREQYPIYPGDRIWVDASVF